MDKIRILAFILALIFGIIFLLGIHMVSAVTWNSTYQNGLISYWGLDTNATDDFGSHSLTEMYNPIHVSTGCINNGCYSFTGTNYLANGTSGTGAVGYPLGNNDSTINLWWKTTSANQQFAFDYGVDGALSNRFIRGNLGNRIVGETNSGANQDDQVINSTMYDGNWHMITWTKYVNGSSKIWLDSVISGGINESTPFTTKQGSIYIGSGFNGGPTANYNFTGLIDEVGVWNRTLTGSEISNIWNNGAGLFLNSIYLINSQTYNKITSSGSSEPFTLNLTYNSSAYNGISVILNYNNTNYTASQIGSGDNLLFSNTITIPTVATSTNKSFYYIIVLSNLTGTTDYLTTINNQTVNSFLVDNCASYTQKLFNFTMYDEESLAKINGTINVLINFYALGTTNLVGTYNNTFNYLTTTSSAVCLNNITSPYTIGYQIQYYGNSSYFTKYKIVQSMVITNTTINQNLNLYNLLQTSGNVFSVIVTGSSLPNQNAGLLVEADKQYLSQNVFRDVEDTLTDPNGYGTLHLTPSTAVYNFIVSYNGQILGTFNNMIVHCQNAAIGQCSFQLPLNTANGTLPNYNNYGNITRSYVFDNNTQTLSLNFVSTDGQIHNVNLWVVEDDGSSNTTICNNTITANSGTINCAIPSMYQNTNIWTTLYSDSNFVETKFFSLIPPIDYFGVDILIELLMFSCVVMMFLNHPTLIVIGSVLGIVMSVVLLFLASGNITAYIGVIMFYVALAIAIIMQIGRKI